MLIDTHCHLDFPQFDQDRDEVIARAKKALVVSIVDVGSSVQGSRRAVELAKAIDMVYATVGVHPHEAETVSDEVVSDLRKLAQDPANKVVAVGEVGLDYYRLSSRGNMEAMDRHCDPAQNNSGGRSNLKKDGLLRQLKREHQLPRNDVAWLARNDAEIKTAQQDAFRKFSRLARELDLPLVIHAREAADDTISILKEECGGKVRGVMHCFSGDEKFLRQCLDLGLYISFTCNLTFKKADDLREVAKKVPVERLMLETDAPYLAPQKFRGTRNEPAYLTELVDLWAQISGLSRNDIERITTHNANTLFNLRGPENSKIAYEIRDSLYLNITNRCTNNCSFCVRSETDFVKGHKLALDGDPALPEILAAIGDPSRYKEIVFCGYGEPTTRLDVVKAVATEMKKQGVKVRLVTNGHGNMINSRPIAPELKGLVDRASVSLNAETAEKYNKICSPEFGEKSYDQMLKFISECVANGIDVEATCLDLANVDIKKCEEIARGLGAKFRLRRYGVTG